LNQRILIYLWLDKHLGSNNKYIITVVFYKIIVGTETETSFCEWLIHKFCFLLVCCLLLYCVPYVDVLSDVLCSGETGWIFLLRNPAFLTLHAFCTSLLGFWMWVSSFFPLPPSSHVSVNSGSCVNGANSLFSSFITRGKRR